jgi:uncharacterized protein YbjT (DUF2867 family)
VVLGGSGLVGGQLLRLLDASPYAVVKAFVRRPLETALAKVQEILVDFDRPETYGAHLSAVDDLFCCLGTTIKAAGSQAAFRKVDCEIPVEVARQGRAAGVTRYLIVTAVGSDPKSGVFYSRVKGETEEALRALEFPRGLKILRPSLLLGERSETRPGERVASVLMRATRPLLSGPLLRYRAIDAHDVACALLAAASRDDPGVTVYEGKALFDLAREGRFPPAARDEIPAKTFGERH